MISPTRKEVKHRMALIPPGLLNAVVSIGVKKGTETTPVGTGFIYGVAAGENDDGQTMYEPFLITNAHVLDGKSQIMLTFNKREASEGGEAFTLNLLGKGGSRGWSKHPTADVAAMPIAVAHLRELGFEVEFCASDNAATVDDLKEWGSSEGDGVFLLGYPMKLAGKDRHHAICRTGCIARIRDLYEGISNEFLIDATVFPGNSGGPVFNKPDLIAIQGTKKQTSCKLIGIATGYLPYHDVAISPQTGRARVVFEENSGLSVVLPVDVIHEVAVAAKAKQDSADTSPA